ncbi:hypothetical protein F5Y11DRAFT_340920 [Daldinia sp. FL1419]|nr:hypothetical protein F5Y11DRAFT_340920 [Daldinia sp. FL1419]
MLCIPLPQHLAIVMFRVLATLAIWNLVKDSNGNTQNAKAMMVPPNYQFRNTLSTIRALTLIALATATCMYAR